MEIKVIFQATLYCIKFSFVPSKQNNAIKLEMRNHRATQLTQHLYSADRCTDATHTQTYKMLNLLNETLQFLQQQIDLYENETNNETTFGMIDRKGVTSLKIFNENYTSDYYYCSTRLRGGERNSGNQFVSTQVRHFLLALYSLTVVLSIVGNLTVIVVQSSRSSACHRKQRRWSPLLHNIGLYLINLAASDLIIGVLCVPMVYTVLLHQGEWHYPGWLCPVSQFAQISGVFVTAYLMMCIGVER